MNIKLLILAAAITAISILSYNKYYDEQYSEVLHKFIEWKTQNNKYYQDDQNIYRFQVYTSNLQLIRTHNQDQTQTYTLGENKFMDLTNDEFANIYLNQVQSKSNQEFVRINHNPILRIQDSIDWRNVTRIEDQGQCGSGWAFSVTSALEGYYALKENLNIQLSNQQLIDCDTISAGCYYGYAYHGFDYARRYGLVSESEYPYRPEEWGRCKIISGPYRIKGFHQIQNIDDQILSLQDMPVSVGVVARGWQLYSSGIFSNCKNDRVDIDHNALNVGYDVDGVWYIQNSWGQDWGEQGFIRLAPGNTCAVGEWAFQNDI